MIIAMLDDQFSPHDMQIEIDQRMYFPTKTIKGQLGWQKQGQQRDVWPWGATCPRKRMPNEKVKPPCDINFPKKSHDS